MKKFYAIAIAAASIFAAACTQGLDTPRVTEKFTFTAGLEPITRTVLNESLQVTWSTHDTVMAVFPSQNVKAGVASVGAEGTTAVFSAEFAGDINTLRGFVLPASAFGAFDGTASVNVTLPDTQESLIGTFDPRAHVAYAAPGLTPVFKNVIAIAEFSIACDDVITSVELSAEGAKIAGAATLNIASALAGSGDFTIDATAGVDKVTMNGNFWKGDKHYFAIYPGTYTRFKLVFTRADGATATATCAEVGAIARGSHVLLGSFDIAAGAWVEPAAPEVPDAEFTAGTKLFIGGTGVDAVDADHHMSYLPDMDYHWDRTVSSAFSDFCAYKNNAGTDFRQEFFNYWTMYDASGDAAADHWTSYFDYEIFVKLVGNADVYFYSKTAGGEPDVYAKINGNYTWKDAPSANAGHVGGKSTVSFKAEAVAFQVPDDGIYRIRFSSVTKEAYVSKLTNAVFRVWAPNGQQTTKNLTYSEHGIWSATISDMDRGNNDNGGCGYKFLMIGFDQDQPYGAQYPQGETKVNAIDPTNNVFSLVPVQGGPWGKNGANGTFSSTSLKAGEVYSSFTATLYMNDTYGFYSHTVVGVPK